MDRSAFHDLYMYFCNLGSLSYSWKLQIDFILIAASQWQTARLNRLSESLLIFDRWANMIPNHVSELSHAYIQPQIAPDFALNRLLFGRNADPVVLHVCIHPCICLRLWQDIHKFRIKNQSCATCTSTTEFQQSELAWAHINNERKLSRHLHPLWFVPYHYGIRSSVCRLWPKMADASSRLHNEPCHRFVPEPPKLSVQLQARNLDVIMIYLWKHMSSTLQDMYLGQWQYLSL